MKRDFSLEARGAVERFRASLVSDLEFDIKSYDKFIHNLSYEITIGDNIIENLNKLEEMNKTAKIETSQDIKDIRKSIEEKLKTQKENLDQLTKFLEKMKLLPEYKKDKKKHEKEISEVLSIL
jgi:predicted  nucleic acid-binding Zn-ribbon protein